MVVAFRDMTPCTLMDMY